MKHLQAALLVTGFLLVLPGCTDNLVSTDESAGSSAAHEPSQLLGKKGDNKGKPGGGGGGGSDSGVFPTWSNVKITPVASIVANGWFDGDVMTLPGPETDFTFKDANDNTIETAADFFGCPLGDTVPCYAVDLTYEQAELDDKVAIRLFPMEEDSACIGGICPEDMTLDDGSEMPDRRRLSLFDDYLGTPYVPVSAFDPIEKTYRFYWQGQHLRVSGDGTRLVGYFRFDRDPDDGGGDLLRASASFIDASSPNTVDNENILEIDRCGSTSPTASDNSGCVFRHVTRPAQKSVRVTHGDPAVVTFGRGKNKTRGIQIPVSQHVPGNTNTSHWTVYLVEHRDEFGGTVIDRSVLATGNSTLQVPAEAGCLWLRPLQVEVFAQTDADFSAAFSADNNGFNAVFDITTNGSVTARSDASSCE